MQNKLSYILIAVSLFFGTVAYGQDSRLDRALDSYESICDRCILLRERSLRGEQIAPEELTSLLEQVSQLRSTLQRGSRNMSPAQKDRFERIRRRYTVAFGGTGTPSDRQALKVARPEMELPKVEWRPDLRLSSGTGEILRSAQNDNSSISLGSPQNDNLSYHPEVAKRPKDLSASLLILGGWSPETFSYGGMITLTGDKWGLYIKGRSNFKAMKANYSCSSDGTADGHIIWTSGKECHTGMALGAGGIFSISGPISLYAGSGYGSTRTLWEDASGKWAEVADYSAQGLCADAGIIFNKGYFTAFAGVSTVSLKTATVEFGIGIRF